MITLEALLGADLAGFISELLVDAITAGHSAGIAGRVLEAMSPESGRLIEPYLRALEAVPRGPSLLQIGDVTAHAATPADAVALILRHYTPRKTFAIVAVD